MNRASRPVAVTTAAIAALIAAELFLQVTQSRTMLMGLYYSPGIHLPSERFGYVFTPHYVGVMQHPEGVFAVPLSLDEYGFRPSVVNRTTGPYVEVLFVGGMSMMFGYALPNDEALPAQVAHSSQHPLRVRNTAWPGFPLFHNYHVARTLLGARFPGDVVVLSIFWKDGTRPVPLGDTQPDPPNQGTYFRFLDGLVVSPKGVAPRVLGPLYYRSFLAYTAGRLADRWIPRPWLQALREPRRWPSRQEPAKQLEPFGEFVKRAVDEIRLGGAEPLVAFLPVPLSLNHSYEKQYAIVPPGIRSVDLHDELVRSGNPITTIVNHYSAETTRAAGLILAREIDALLEGG